jgi:hypothetical protein
VAAELKASRTPKSGERRSVVGRGNTTRYMSVRGQCHQAMLVSSDFSKRRALAQFPTVLSGKWTA